VVRRWQVAVLAALSALALACEGAADGSSSSRTTRPSRSARPASMAALGDSITAGFASCATLVACARNSWSTGTSAAVNSHYRRIRADDDRIDGHEHNFAVPGARAADLEGQARRAVAARAEYVTILIGANDACRATTGDMTPAATFRDRIDAALRVLRTGLPKARVLVVSLPDLYRLWQLGHTDTHAVRAWNLGVCPSLLADPTSTDRSDQARRRAVAARIDAYDDELEAACRAYGKRCRWDHGAVHDVRFSLSLVNHLDYFHPDADGQKRLAEVTYPGRFDW
jgi:lysophospholipase L1-like esterase